MRVETLSGTTQAIQCLAQNHHIATTVAEFGASNAINFFVGESVDKSVSSVSPELLKSVGVGNHVKNPHGDRFHGR